MSQCSRSRIRRPRPRRTIDDRTAGRRRRVGRGHGGSGHAPRVPSSRRAGRRCCRPAVCRAERIPGSGGEAGADGALCSRPGCVGLRAASLRTAAQPSRRRRGGSPACDGISVQASSTAGYRRSSRLPVTRRAGMAAVRGSTRSRLHPTAAARCCCAGDAGVLDEALSAMFGFFFHTPYLQERATLPPVFRILSVLPAGLAVGASLWATRRRAPGPTELLALWLGFAALGTTLSLRGYGHYLVQTLAPASLCLTLLARSTAAQAASRRGGHGRSGDADRVRDLQQPPALQTPRMEALPRSGQSGRCEALPSGR